eukprot:scaffold45_cov368-Prasinococcus_capsulatus_cf.AAC.13
MSSTSRAALVRRWMRTGRRAGSRIALKGYSVASIVVCLLFACASTASAARLGPALTVVFIAFAEADPVVTISVDSVQSGSALVSISNEVEIRAFQFNLLESDSGLAPGGSITVDVEDVLEDWIVQAASEGGVATVLGTSFGEDDEIPVSEDLVPVLTIQGLESPDDTILCLDNEIIVAPPLLVEDPPGSGDFIVVLQNVTVIQGNEEVCQNVMLPDVILSLNTDNSGSEPVLDVVMFSTEAVAGANRRQKHHLGACKTRLIAERLCSTAGLQFNVVDLLGDESIAINEFLFSPFVPDDFEVTISENTFFAFTTTGNTIPAFPTSQLLVQLTLDTNAEQFCLEDPAFFSIMEPVPVPLNVTGRWQRILQPASYSEGSN